MNLRSRKNKPSAEVHTSALNDIMFFLMLFFLLASAVSNPQVVKLLLPKSSAENNLLLKRPLRYRLQKIWAILLIKHPFQLKDWRLQFNPKWLQARK